MEIQQCIDKIRQAPLDKLKDSNWLENHFLLELGLNNEEIQEFPVHLHKYCGFGLKSWQYPNQFSKYLVWLSSQNISNYLEIGCRHGGTFIITVEYLERFTKLDLAVAVDPFYSELMQNYAKAKNNIDYLNVYSQNLALRDILETNYFDLVLVDGDHSEYGVKHDYHLVKDRGKYIVFHDIVNSVCPGVVNLWSNVKNLYKSSIEFIDQYDSVGQSYLGIGIIDTTHKRYSSISIEPVKENIQRPFWSIMIPSYNCSEYLAETLNSVLKQDIGEEQMQIEVIDDCSTQGNPEEIVSNIGKGRISFFRHPKNQGAIHTFNTCIQRAKGQWVHILHGDDFVLPGFYESIHRGIEAAPDIGAAFSRSITVDENSNHQGLNPLQRETPGILDNWVERIAINQRIDTPSIVVKRSVYETIGGFNLELFHCADWEMWKRIAVNYPVWYEPQSLACYRFHSASDTSRLMRTGANVANARRAIEISEAYLPSDLAIKVSNQARENFAVAGLNLALKMLLINDIDAAVAQAWEGLNCSSSPAIINYLVNIIISSDSSIFLPSLIDKIVNKPGNIDAQIILPELQKLSQAQLNTDSSEKPLIIFDAVFFQLYQTGIARVWKSLLTEWSNNGFAKHIIVIDRDGTAPQLSGLKYVKLSRYNYSNIAGERELLQQICDQEGADLFISSYYTTPITTPSVFIAYDMIPEVMGWDLNNPMWQDKQQGIKHASGYIAISHNTAFDLSKCFDYIPLKSITVAYCGVSKTFTPSKLEDISILKTKYGITRPYFLLPGVGSGYKNSILFFQAFSELVSSYGFDIVVTGGGGSLESQFREYTFGSVVHILKLSDEELATAYSGAVALVYPSKYEGFGMPIIEAMACGCPVITCPNASIPEVAEDAAIYVNDDDVDGLVNALCEVQKPAIRQSLITAGLAQAKKFSWSTMAEIVSHTLINTTLQSLNLREINLIIFPDWSESEDLICLELAQVIKTLAIHPDSSKTTLLIDATNISTEDAELLLSSVTMNLLMEEDLDISDGLAISLVENLADIQWQVLIPQVHGRIILEYENKEALVKSKAENISVYELTSFSQLQEEEFFFT